ncbi:Carnitinyl-CoA dehydratase [Zhongshania aliphaticivorans]|uniref:Carnitinyl-CoA dehydratase n=1 Tax=Zhongshania aliphaticivorans TaxID=1470434 RepID=A0A5S9NB63_9GAMM|nr:enoyl-CoA hydratase-related protein [Zhongshania aliphaticivorans]CAA0087403.1 Carnitinyl-CoA dehydratase [Zhongshania aliphaticivorans]CAA0114779.1 Carnitinyl-CoA dehydratase [Zhongshania aliphaticivorans]
MRKYNTLQWENANGIAKITLNRPDAANSVNLEMAQELMHVAMVCDEDSSIRAVILTATGKMFCAGGDVPSFKAAGDDIGLLLKDVTACLHSANSRFARMTAPLIVAVNGTAAGAGFSLAVSGDIVVAADTAKFTMAYTGIGASPDGGSSVYLPKLIGLRRTQELMLTNRVLSAQEALDWGLLTKVVAADELVNETEALANKLANGPLLAHGQIKSLLLGSYSNSLETQLEIESRGIAKCISSPEGREGLLAFAEKRKPDFKSVS